MSMPQSKVVKECEREREREKRERETDRKRERERERERDSVLVVTRKLFSCKNIYDVIFVVRI